MPFSPLHLFAFIFLLALLIVFIQVGALTIAFEKLGLSPQSAAVLLFSSLFGSAINLPLFKVNAQAPPPDSIPRPIRSLLRHAQIPFTGKTIIAVNVGGCLIPLTFSYYLMVNNLLSIGLVVIATTAVALVSYWASRPIPGLGIGMPIFVAPATAALVAIGLDSTHSAPLAYICGTLGVLVGADLMRLKDIRQMGVPMASIGGAGTFDGIFITGIVAVLLA